MPRKYLSIDGIATLLHHRGPTTLPDAPPRVEHGRPVLALHDRGGNGNEFRSLLRALESDQTPMAFDFPGHGRSGSLDSLGAIDRMADFVRGVLDKLGLEEPILLGVGMGSAVALELAVREPRRVAGLVLCGATANSSASDEEVDRLRRITEGRERRSFDPSRFAEGTEREVLQRAFMEWMKTDPRATYGDTLACREWSLVGRESEILCPARIVVGAEEGEEACSQAVALVESLPNASVREIEGARSQVHVEQPEALAQVVNDVVGGLVG